MLMMGSKVISNSPEGLQQSLDVIYNMLKNGSLKQIPKNLISLYLAVMHIWLLSLHQGNS